MEPARVALSICATVIGWASGMLYYISIGYFSDALGWKGDLPAIAYYTAWYIVLGWFIVFLPILRTMSPESEFFALSRLPWLGALLGLAAFMVLAGWWAPLWLHWFYLLYPAVVGGATGVSFACFQRMLLRRQSAS